MEGGNFGWIEIVLFYGGAIGFGVWQFVSMDRKLKKTRAEREAREAADLDVLTDDRDGVAEHLGHGLLVVLDELLLEQADVLVELAHATFDDALGDAEPAFVALWGEGQRRGAGHLQKFAELQRRGDAADVVFL